MVSINYMIKPNSIMQCKILPPRGLYIPVLPVKMNMCRTCSENHQQTRCQHNDKEDHWREHVSQTNWRKHWRKDMQFSASTKCGISMKRNSTIRKRKLEDSLPITWIPSWSRKPAVGQSGVRAKTINGRTSETITKRKEYSWATTT